MTNGNDIKVRHHNLPFFLTQQFATYIYIWNSVNKHQIKMYFSYRLHVVLSYRERWTDWHQTPAHMMISSQSPYPTVTRMETSTQNRSVISSTHSLWTLLNYWADHYLAMCTGELWISIIKPIQIKMPILIRQTVLFKPHQQFVGQNTKHACSRWNIVLLVQDQHKSVSKQTVMVMPRPYFSKLTWKVIYIQKSTVKQCE